jgi:hypothetical protein
VTQLRLKEIRKTNEQMSWVRGLIEFNKSVLFKLDDKK